MTTGQVWTRELLGELRRQRYRPRAWIGFLAASFARARATRADRGREHRQTLALGAAGLAAWIAVAGVRPWLALAGAIWWLLVVAMVDWHLGMLDDQQRLGLANVLSTLRAGVVPALLVLSPFGLAAVLIPAGLLDGIDGPIARARGEATRLGLWLDGSVDGLVLSAAAVGAGRHQLLPWWAVALVLGRHASQWLAVALAYFVRLAAPASLGFVSGKLPGLAVFAGLAVAALHLSGGVVLVSLGAGGGLATFAASALRGWRLQLAC
jgi:phosphatidylglycerophosphate synthase